MKNQITALLCTLFFSIPLISQDLQSETRTVPSFNKLEIQSVVQVEIYKGSVGKIEVEAENIDLSDIVSEVKNNTLILDLNHKRKKKNRYENLTVKVKIYMEDIEAIRSYTASSFETMDNFDLDHLSIKMDQASKGYLKLNVENLDVRLNSASCLELEGRCTELDAHVNSASKLRAFELDTQDADVDASSVGRAEVNVTNNLKASASSMSKVFYKGNPSNLEESKSSMAKISKAKGDLERVR